METDFRSASTVSSSNSAFSMWLIIESVLMGIFAVDFSFELDSERF